MNQCCEKIQYWKNIAGPFNVHNVYKTSQFNIQKHWFNIYSILYNYQDYQIPELILTHNWTKYLQNLHFIYFHLRSLSRNHFIRIWVTNFNDALFILFCMIFIYEKCYSAALSSCDATYCFRVSDFNVNLFNIDSTLQQH